MLNDNRNVRDDNDERWRRLQTINQIMDRKF